MSLRDSLCVEFCPINDVMPFVENLNIFRYWRCIQSKIADCTIKTASRQLNAGNKIIRRMQLMLGVLKIAISQFTNHKEE